MADNRKRKPVSDGVRTMIERKVVKYNVGGRPVDVALATIQLYPLGTLATMLEHPEMIVLQDDGRIFVDWNPTLFEAMIQSMRMKTTDVRVPCMSTPLEEWTSTLGYFGLTEPKTEKDDIIEECFKELTSQFKWSTEIVGLNDPKFCGIKANVTNFVCTGGYFERTFRSNDLFRITPILFLYAHEKAYLEWLQKHATSRFNLINRVVTCTRLRPWGETTDPSQALVKRNDKMYTNVTVLIVFEQTKE